MSRFAPQTLDLTDDELIADFLDVALDPMPTARSLWWMQSADGEVLPTLCELTDPPEPLTLQAAYDVVSSLCELVAHLGERPGLLLIWQRPGVPAPTDADVLWVPAAREACRFHEVELHGSWLNAGSARPLRLDA